MKIKDAWLQGELEGLLLYSEEYNDKRHDELLKTEDKDAVYYLKPHRYENFNIGNCDIKDIVEWLRHNQREEEAKVLESLDKETIDRILGFAKREWESQIRSKIHKGNKTIMSYRAIQFANEET